MEQIARNVSGESDVLAGKKYLIHCIKSLGGLLKSYHRKAA